MALQETSISSHHPRGKTEPLHSEEDLPTTEGDPTTGTVLLQMKTSTEEASEEVLEAGGP